MAVNLPQSITFKVLGIAFLALLMLIPLVQVQSLIDERSSLRAQALGDIAQRWGAAQNVGGPVLAIPKRVRVQSSSGWVTHDYTEIVLADRLAINGSLKPELRSYGIYSTPVYEAGLKIDGQFLARDLRALEGRKGAAEETRETTYLFDQAELRLPIADVRGIRRISTLKLDGKEHVFGPANGSGALRAIALSLDLSTWVKAAQEDEAHRFELQLTLAGTGSLQWLPLARQTEASLSAPWPNPSFVGGFLPAQRAVDEKGFSAQWQVLDLNRSYGQHWQEGEGSIDPAAAAFGVNLYQPADVYQQNERAGKYGVLFVALTFVAFFLFEVLKKLRVHPVQYLLVGLALTTFYVVLLALSEQIGFALAYLAAATAVVLLVGGYAAAVLRARKAGAVLGAALALIYALLYGLVVSEQYSLLMGAIALLVVVAALMYLTRRVDWYTYATS
ncbi:MAG: cell envelope integrity protein CreD [Rudaea sp.]|nr:MULTISPECIES: cell envelope integrity protein CreD [unclassified Rudaea]MBN8886373.1 cell envelope integrity protein CreD [Rudaea sp.]MBR0345027.1 cell envelope integrity protein CreD [Rudaea sp.]